MIFPWDIRNAYAYREEQQNIVAISLGSIYKCLYTANLFMLKDDFIPEAGEGNACYKTIEKEIKQSK